MTTTATAPAAAATSTEDTRSVGEVCRDLALEILTAQGEVETFDFSSGNVGLYHQEVLSGQAGRAKGLPVPVKGSVKVAISVIIVDPANKKPRA